MKIIADSNIPLAPEAFAHIGKTEVLDCREITREKLIDADILLCRTTIKVNEALLEGTKVRFVATSTIGFDHVDTKYLASRGIGFASAPGSNSNSVSEYVIATALTLAGEMGRTLEGKTIGVIGCGNVGSKVVAKARALGMNVIENDPPLARKTGDPRYRPLEEVFAADIVTLHVPLERTGADATFHLADEKFFGKLKFGTIFINSSRGAVHDTAALQKAIDTGAVTAVALDVWENEPLIDTKLLDSVAIGTPHVAGHSYDGKVNGTAMIYESACQFLGIAPQWKPAKDNCGITNAAIEADAAGKLRRNVPEGEDIDPDEIDDDAPDKTDEDVLREIIVKAYDVLEDDEKLRNIPRDESRGKYFQNLRSNYRPRREWHNYSAAVKNVSPNLLNKISGLGFK